MEPLRWVLLLAGIALIGAIFCYSRGWYPKWKWRVPPVTENTENSGADAATAAVGDSAPDAEVPPPSPSVPPMQAGSKVITVRIMPREGSSFPAEELILALRAAGMRHGQFGIFHSHAAADERIRFSVASLVEPGSFDLSRLKESTYQGISIFAVLPAPEDGVQLFDDLVAKAREISKAIDGVLTDEQGGTFSLQRERYMREELIEYLRRRGFAGDISQPTSLT